MKVTEIKINSLEELDAYGIDLLTQLQIKDRDKAVVLALSGDLGAGKTTLVQTIARDLGVIEVVTSPTFVIMKQYETSDKYFSKLIHIDAYRIEDVTEMKPLGFENLLKQANTLICIEWAERIKPLLPKDTLTLELANNNNGTHTIKSHG
ncbi:tRNA (adenosine(37)-N6)-threonylcarbamoyltransferase complex ATPase subunit type 1 TsaE [Candidatus Kaiserbacteria bacterium CG_4_9_14_0_2_um_filter_41_32]|uniref:tRNA threonylcarbamoyladenosine biosynthesis protein TsaE n=1 Tax=Candidatus Kaiserbacteria bacterium CG_4_9_14_0_2_um_filter_41_32 TaxID=1974601 RepID=A0A2M8FEG1_9BACT|nr:MAG: tRNA (adenosine(37)-N6)-threonylcarbamoyltransferase complex ATPase subunit type 1 TsaE [Candidatus Kaiserbacteria bacterium CG_4_9_14_0_2_um_filter_41_32]